MSNEKILIKEINNITKLNGLEYLPKYALIELRNLLKTWSFQLISDKETIKSQSKEIEELKKDKLFYSKQWEKQSKQNTQLKQKLKESEDRNKELVLGIRNMMSDKCWDVDKQAKQLLEKYKQPIKQ